MNILSCTKTLNNSSACFARKPPNQTTYYAYICEWFTYDPNSKLKILNKLHFYFKKTFLLLLQIPNSYVNVCEHCGKMFTSQSTFADHKLEHKVNKSNAVCKVCGKSFGKRKTLGKHMKIHVRTFGFSQPSITEINLCLTLIHYFQSDVKKPCPVCGKRFSYNNNLRAHLRTHDRTLPSADKFYSHICPVCSKSFPRPHLLRKHMAKEHEVMEFRQPMHPMA